MLFIYLFNNIKIFSKFGTTLYHGKFRKEEKKGNNQSRANMYVILRDWREIDFDYTSQLLAKTVTIVWIPKLIKQCEKVINLLLSTNPKRECINLGFKPV